MKYKHISTWEKMLGARDWYINDMQRLAERDNAPIDATHRLDDGSWHRASNLEPNHRFWTWHNEIWQQ